MGFVESQAVCLKEALTYFDISQVYYVFPINLKTKFEVNLVQASHSYSNQRDKIISKTQMQKNTKTSSYET